MTCTESQKRIDPFLDNEVELATALEMQRHLEECAACESFVADRLAVRRCLQTRNCALFRQQICAAGFTRNYKRKSALPRLTSTGYSDSNFLTGHCPSWPVPPPFSSAGLGPPLFLHR
jgi:hypothetical protein